MGNALIAIVLMIAAGVTVWQFMSRQQDMNLPDDNYYYDDLDNAEESVEETEEFMRRMERLSKRTYKEDDDT